MWKHPYFYAQQKTELGNLHQSDAHQLATKVTSGYVQHSLSQVHGPQTCFQHHMAKTTRITFSWQCLRGLYVWAKTTQPFLENDATLFMIRINRCSQDSTDIE